MQVLKFPNYLFLHIYMGYINCRLAMMKKFEVPEKLWYLLRLVQFFRQLLVAKHAGPSKTEIRKTTPRLSSWPAR